jgi:mannose-6-phosphate isomerase-like protein (cupin superfamily)
MKRSLLLFSALFLVPGSLHAQQRLAATYITTEQIATVNAQPGTDRQIVSVDIGKLNLAVGIIHRGATTAPTAPTAAIAANQACGAPSSAPPTGELVSGILHDHQTETYVIVSGGGTLVTGGQIVYGRKSAPDNAVTTTLNGPSCSGFIVGSDVVRRQVKTGDVIVIPALVPHGWTGITDHVDYLSVRPDPDRVLPAGYVHPSIKP